MAARHWLNSSGNWTTAADWTGGAVPGSTDDAILDAPGFYTVTEDPSSAAPIDVNSIAIGAGATLAVSGVAGNLLGAGGIDNQGALDLDGTAALRLAGGLVNSGAIELDDRFGSDGGGSLTVAGTLSNSGTVSLGNSNLGAATPIALGGLVNTIGASFAVSGSAGHPASLGFTAGGAGFSENDGSFALYDTAPLSLSPATFTNRGTLDLDGTTALRLAGGLVNSGAIELDDRFGSDGGGSLTVAGILSNSGTVSLGNSNLGAATPIALGGLVNTIGASFAVSGSAAHPASLNFTGGAAAFTENDGSFALYDTAPLALSPATFTNRGTLDLDGTTALRLAGGLVNSGAIELDDRFGSDGGGSLTVAGILTNSGTVSLGNSNLGAATPVALGGLVNTIGASFAVSGSAGHPASLGFTGGAAAFSENDGSFALYDTAPLSLAPATFTNRGTLDLDGTTALRLAGGLANSGAIELDDRFGSDGGGSLTVAGILTNSGTVSLGNSNLGAATPIALGGLVNTIGASFAVSGSAGHPASLGFTAGGAGFSENDGSFALYDTAPLSLAPATFTNRGTLDLDGTAALRLAGGLVNSGAIELDDRFGSDGGGSLTVAGTLSNSGTVSLGNSNLGAATPIALGGLVNTIGASFAVSGSAAHPASLNFTGGAAAFTENDGSFALYDTAPLALSPATFTNRGTLDLDGTTALRLAGGLVNSGAIELDDRFGSDGGGSLTVAGILTNSGTVSLGNSNLGAATPVALGGLVNTIGASFAVSGSAGHPASLGFTGGAAAFSENDGSFALYDTAPLSLAPATFTNRGTLDLDGTTALRLAGGLANSGAIELDDRFGSDGGGSLTVAGILTNSGTVSLGNTNLGAATPITLGGLVNTIGASFAVSGSAAHPASLNFTGGAAAFTENDGSFALYDTAPLSLSPATFTNRGTLDLDGTTALKLAGGLVNSGAIELDDRFGSDGGGSLTVAGILTNSGSVSLGNTNLGAATPITLGGLVNTIGASFAVSGSAAHPASLNFTGGAAAFTENDGSFALYDTAPLSLSPATFTNRGTLDLDGTTALRLAGGLVNSGAIELDDRFGSDGGGSLTVAGILTNSGSVSLGNSNLGAATPIALGGLVNTIGASFAVSGSAGHPETVTVNGPAQNAAGIAIGSFAVFNVTGGNAFTQTGGTTTVQGTLSAAVIAIDGGRLAVDSTSFKNTGTMIAADGGKIDFSAGGLTNLSATTLSGGIYIVDAGSTLQLPNNATVTTLAANLTVSGLGSAVQGFSTTTDAEVAIESTLTTIAAGGALSVSGERSYTTANALADSGSLTVATGSTLTAPSLNIAAGGRLVVGAEATVNLSAPLTVAGTATIAGTIDGGGAIAVTMASGGGRLILDPGFAFGGKVVGGGAASVLELAKGSGTGVLKTLGVNFTNPGTVTVDAGATWTVYAQAAALSGVRMIGSGGADTLVLTTAGAVNLSGVSGFPAVDLAAGNSTVALSNTTLSGGPVTIRDGASGNNTINASAVTATGSSPLAYIAGAGIDKFTGGAESDTVVVGATALAHDTLSGGGGADTLATTTPGALDIAGVSGFETYRLASGAADSLTLTNANFAGVSGAAITIDGGNAGNTVNAGGLPATDRIVAVGGAGKDVFTGGLGNDTFEFSIANLAGTDIVKGGGGADTLIMTSAGGTVMAGGVSGVETYRLANGAANRLTLTTANFAGVTGTPPTITVDAGNTGDTLSEAGVPQPDQAVLLGGSGADTLIAGQHATMTGGGGADLFEFMTSGSTTTPDINTITDFTHGTDKIGFSNSGFDLGLKAPFPQPLPASLFVANPTGSFTNNTQRFAYDTATGVLVYGSSGVSPTGSLDPVATLTGHPAVPTVTAADLFVIG